MRTLSALLAAAALAACVAPEDLEDLEVEEASEEIGGTDATSYKQGLILFRYANVSPAQWHTGLLIVKPGKEASATHAGLVLTTTNNIPPSGGTSCPPTVYVKYGKLNNMSTGVVDRTVINTIRHGWLPLALFQLDEAIPINPSFGTLPTLSDSEPVASQPVRCWAYNGSSPLRHAIGQQSSDTGNGYQWVATLPTSNSLTTADAGAVCTHATQNTAFGMSLQGSASVSASGAPIGSNEQIALNQVKEWLTNQVLLSNTFWKSWSDTR